MADVRTRSLLREWGLESLEERFSENDIDMEALRGLTDSMIAELIPSIGKRSKFFTRFRQYMACFSAGIDSTSVVGLTLLDLNLPVITDATGIDITEHSLNFNISDTTVYSDANDSHTDFINVTGTTMPPNDGTNDELGLPPLLGSISNSDVSRPRSRPMPNEERVQPGRRKPRPKSQSLRTTLKYPCQLPVLSSSLHQALNGEGVVVKSSKFVREMADFLLILTGGSPTAMDYDAYTRTIIQNYPLFKDDSATKPNESLILRMSHYIRNKRYAEKKKQHPNQTKDVPEPKRKNVYLNSSEEQTEPTSDINISSASTSSTLSPVTIPEADLLIELKGRGKKGGKHAMMLLQKTQSSRRQFASQADTTKEIIVEFPHLNNYTLFLYDFSLMFPNADIDNKFGLLMKKLQTILVVQENGDLGNLKILKELERNLHPRRLKNCRPAIAVFKVGGEVDLTTEASQSPCITLFVNDVKLQDVFLLSQGDIKCRGEANLTVCDAVKLLMGSYFLLDRKYPSYYDGLLSFLEAQLLGKERRGQNLVYLNFMKKFNKLV